MDRRPPAVADLLIAGGGMAGMAAAARAVDLGLDVVVAEKGDACRGLGGAVGRHRLDGAHDAAARGEAVALDAPLPPEPSPLREPPFHALAVAPCITFAFGGLRVDPDGRVLDRDGRRLPNLYAAGADAGGLQGPGYVGGLALGLVFGPRAAEAVHREAMGVAPPAA